VVGSPMLKLRARIAGLVIGLPLLAFALLSAVPASASATVWLCKPGQKPDPCTPGLSTTVLSPSGKKLGVENPKAEKSPPIDCFYIYPTISDQKTGNSNLDIDPAQKSIALYQPARYSQYCKVYAPMYHEVTIAGIGIEIGGPPTTPPNNALAYRDVRSAFRDYIEHYNHGRGFIIIGHSQGSLELRTLAAQEIDPKPAVRRRLVSAILLGGNVLVKKGSDVGGDFKHIPACHSKTQLGCVIAWSTFDQPVPPLSAGEFFGRPVGLFGPAARPDEAVLCTNPAQLSGTGKWIDPIDPTTPFAPGGIATVISLLKLPEPHPPTVFWTAPASYSAACVDSNGANVLEIKPHDGAPTPNPSPLPSWGLHLLDPSIALGNLMIIVKAESAAFVNSGR
jgi:Protein of unknown function (DUF3089)